MKLLLILLLVPTISFAQREKKSVVTKAAVGVSAVSAGAVVYTLAGRSIYSSKVPEKMSAETIAKLSKKNWGSSTIRITPHSKTLGPVGNLWTSGSSLEEILTVMNDRGGMVKSIKNHGTLWAKRKVLYLTTAISIGSAAYAGLTFTTRETNKPGRLNSSRTVSGKTDGISIRTVEVDEESTSSKGQ